MEMERSYMTERILHLTLEIIYLLTGEDYEPVKKGIKQHTTPSNCPKTLERWSKNQRCIREPPPLSPTPEKENDKKILEVIQKIIELMTGEVPIRCQDVTFYFSMEEWAYIEGHKDLYKDVMMEKRPPLTSPDGSSNRNPPERCPLVLYTRDSTQYHEKITEDSVDLCQDIDYDYQGENMVLVKVEGLETEDPYVMGDEPCEEGEELPPEITIDGRYKSYDTERLPVILGDDDNTTTSPLGENHIAPNLHPLFHGTQLLSDPSINRGSFPNHSQLVAHPTDHTREMISYSESGEHFPNTAQLMPHHDAHSQEKPYSCSECGKTFGKKANLARHQRMHTDGKSYSCSECGKCFLRKSSFVEHQRMHKGEKTYSCSECGKCFQWRSTLFYHQRRHKDGRYNRSNRGRRRGGNFTADPQRVVPILPKPNPVLPCLYLSSVPVAHVGSFTAIPDQTTSVHIGNKQLLSPVHAEPLNEGSNPLPPKRTYLTEGENPMASQRTYTHYTAHIGDETLDHGELLSEGSNCVSPSRTYPSEGSNLVPRQRAYKVGGHRPLREEVKLLPPQRTNLSEGAKLVPAQRTYKVEGHRPLSEEANPLLPQRTYLSEGANTVPLYRMYFSEGANPVSHQRTYKVEGHQPFSEDGNPFPAQRTYPSEGANPVSHQRIYKVDGHRPVREDTNPLPAQRTYPSEGADPMPPQRTYKVEDRCPVSPYNDDINPKPTPLSQDKLLTVKKEFSCLQCGKSFFEESNLLKHQKNHSQSKPHSCTMCRKAFSKKSNLLRHQRLHSKEKLFSCSECGKCFLRKSVLVEHQRMHTGEKKYRCSECGKCFQWRSSHFYHIRKHRGVMPVSCPECGKCFAQKSHLAQHQKMHAAEKQYLIFNSFGTER